MLSFNGRVYLIFIIGDDPGHRCSCDGVMVLDDARDVKHLGKVSENVR